MMPQYVFALVCGNKQKAEQHDTYTDVEQKLFTLNSRIILCIFMMIGLGM